MCPLCRKDTDKGVLYKIETHPPPEVNVCMLWKYEARSGGWWCFSKSHSDELDRLYNTNPHTTHNLNILAKDYIIDFSRMIQIGNNGQTRKIKHPGECNGVIGICGLNMNTKI